MPELPDIVVYIEALDVGCSAKKSWVCVYPAHP